jgi:hypothetical protein
VSAGAHALAGPARAQCRQAARGQVRAGPAWIHGGGTKRSGYAQ